MVWSNQFEPKTKKQHANLVYKNRFRTGVHSEIDIREVIKNDFNSIPDHDLLVGGFPYQDFSVANRSSNDGLDGRKGKLWWSIIDILKKKGKKAPKYLFFENVDRLLISPSKQRGRDFGVMLSSLNSLGYAVEWRVINAAEYGFPQRRRRVYILGYKKGTDLYKSLYNSDAEKWLLDDGITATAFPCIADSKLITGSIPTSIKDCMLNFSNEHNRFQKSGYMIGGKYYTLKVKPNYNGNYSVLKDILIPESVIPESFYIKPKDLPKWRQYKSKKVKTGVNQKTGVAYVYRQGNLAFPDDIHKPSRTIITKEGGTDVAREKHVVCIGQKYRRLHPIELERLNGFPDDFTKCDGVTDIKRAFFMGNALVIGVVRKLGKELANEIFNNY